MRQYVRGTMWLVAAALVVGNVGAVLAQQEGSGTRSAKCLVRIMSDPDMLPIGAAMISSLLDSTPVLGEPAREILGLKAGSIDDVVAVSFQLLEHSQSRMGSVLTGSIAVDVHGDDAKPAAEELLSAICERLERALQQVGAIDQHRLQLRLAEVERELAQLDGQYQYIRAARRELLEQAGRDDLSRARIAEAIRDLEDTRLDIELSLAGAQAREAALTEQIAKIGQQAIEAAEKSAVVDELRQIVDIRKMELARVQELHQTGQASVSDLNVGQEGLARARADLARYRESVTKTAGAELLAQLNHELVSLSVESAQQEAQQQEIQAQQQAAQTQQETKVMESQINSQAEVEKATIAANAKAQEPVTPRGR